MNRWKQKAIAAILLATLLILPCAGCGEKAPASPAPSEPAPATPAAQPSAPAASAAPEPSAVPNPEAEKKYQAAVYAYEGVLDNNCDLLYNGFRDEEDYSFVASGVMEAAGWMKRAALLQTIGYTYEDISGDGIPELLIGVIPDENAEAPEKQVIFAGYTCKDGEPVCFLDGMARNSYQWLGGGRFYNFGSGGAAYSGFGTFHVSPDGTELQCEDWYFSDTKGSDHSELGYYHNTTGVWDKAAAEEINMTPEAFWELSDKCGEDSETMDLTPFADYKYTGYVAQPLDCKVYADYYDDASYRYAKFDDASQYMENVDPAYEVKVLFQADEDVKDFALLALTFKDVDAHGHAAFDTAEVFRVPVLRADVPLMVPMNFPGDIPSNGFSYTDADGTTKAYTIAMSGYDGSLTTALID